MLNLVNISPSAQTTRTPDSAKIGGIFTAALNVEIKNADSITFLNLCSLNLMHKV